MPEKITPPKTIPPELLDRYTLNGKVLVIGGYRDDTDFCRNYTKDIIATHLAVANNKQNNYYGDTDFHLYKALDAHCSSSQRIAVMGSMTPFYECVCLAYGCFPTSIDYNEVICEDSRIKTKTIHNLGDEQFDAAISVSTFEHDGLGRYGDPLNPDGDLAAMQEMRYVLKDRGILFLSIPIGADGLVWNKHRIYGPIRLPLMLADWKLITTYGFNENQFNVRRGAYVQPIFVLENHKPLKEFPQRKLS